MTTAKEYGEQLYEAAVLTAGAVGVSYASRKLTKDTLGVPMTLNGSVKLALAFQKGRYRYMGRRMLLRSSGGRTTSWAIRSLKRALHDLYGS